MVNEEKIANWADSAPNNILRALCRAWMEAKHIPQNCGQYRRCVIEPAIKDAVEIAKKTGEL